MCGTHSTLLRRLRDAFQSTNLLTGQSAKRRAGVFPTSHCWMEMPESVARDGSFRGSTGREFSCSYRSPDDPILLPVERDRLVDDGGVCAEAIAPERVAQVRPRAHCAPCPHPPMYGLNLTKCRAHRECGAEKSPERRNITSTVNSLPCLNLFTYELKHIY